MTTAAAVTDPPDDIPEYTSRRSRELQPEDRLPFRFDGDLYVLDRPKVSVATAMLSLIDDGDERSIAALGIDLTRLLMSLLAYVEEEPPEPLLIQVPAESAAEPVDYESWKVPDLRAEVRRRNGLLPDDAVLLSASGGGKKELVRTLREDDESRVETQWVANPKAGQLRGQALLRKRLADPRDGFDLPDLEVVFRDLMNAMFRNRPIQARPASSARSRAPRSRG